MSHRKGYSVPTLRTQVNKVLNSKIAFGESKYEAKKTGEYLNKIYSKSTLESYKKWGGYFVDYCEKEHQAKKLDECRQYAQEYIDTTGGSAWTQKLKASAISKIYGMSYIDDMGQIAHTSDFPVTPERRREDITRSRFDVPNDRNFSESRHNTLVNFCRSTGLRRSELTSLRGDQLIEREDGYYLDIVGKGGKERLAPIIGQIDMVIDLCQKAGSGRVFEHIPANCDIHSYRSDYAIAIYEANARPIEDIPYDSINAGTGHKYQSEVYHCQNDKSGVKLDKAAMLIASRALGHNRINIIASNYLR